MVTLDDIIGNALAEVLIFGLSFVLSNIFPALFEKRKVEWDKVDALKISIFLLLVSVVNLILNISFWNNQNLMILFTLLSVAFGISTVYIFENQCPYCKKFIDAKNKIGEEVEKEFTKKIPYQPMKIIKYSNGRVKKSYPFGKKKTRIEKWERKTEFYKCNYCEKEWDSGQKDHVIFVEKERHNIINTREKDPEEPSFY